DGTFQLQVNVAPQSGFGGFTADFDGDGRTDFLIYNNQTLFIFMATALPDLTITQTQFLSANPGLAGGDTITVSNVGARSTSGFVTVSDSLPASLTPINISGNGWSCTLAALTCTRSDSLPPGSAYPPIFLAAVLGDNAPGTIVNTVSVSGGGDTNSANNSATD